MNPSHRNPDNLSDFRDEAAAASARLLVERGAVAPLEAGISLCLQGEEGGREALLRMRQITTVRLILGNLALIPGLVILVISQIQVFRERESNWPLTLGAIVLMFLGTAIMLAGPPLHQGLVRRWTRNRPDVFHPGPDDPRPIPDEIENRETF